MADLNLRMSIWASPYKDGQIAAGTPSQLASPPDVFLSYYTGTPLSLEYVGQAPGFVAGAVQINFVTPLDAQTGPTVQVSFGGINPENPTIAIK